MEALIIEFAHNVHHGHQADEYILKKVRKLLDYVHDDNYVPVTDEKLKEFEIAMWALLLWLGETLYELQTGQYPRPGSNLVPAELSNLNRKMMALAARLKAEPWMKKENGN